MLEKIICICAVLALIVIAVVVSDKISKKLNK